MTAGVRVLAVAALAAASMAHVGSPDTFFTGDAGPYPVRVTVRLPGVIPGLAQIVVRVPGVSDIRSMTVQAVQWNVGPEGAPPPDPALPVPGDRELYAADLWFMAPTSYRVLVAIEGSRGRGTAIVPVVALATEQRAMNPYLGALLAALGLFLAAGLLTIVGAAVRESVLPPGTPPDAARLRRGRTAAGLSALLIALALWGGARWWGVEAESYGESVLYRPFNAVATAGVEKGERRLTLAIEDSRWPPAPGMRALARYNALIPDHGKLMHMFLVREPAHDVFAHVHPVPRSLAAETFDVPLPAIPAGRYRVFGDIVHESGYAQTLIATADVPANPGGLASGGDPDDSWFAEAAVAEAPEAVFRHADGMTVAWSRGTEPLVEGQDRLLTFTARAADGSPVPLEPYMGMLGHVAIGRDDGSVFAHLHPSGSISMAALQRFGGDPHAAHAGTSLSIPFAFAKAGRYRMWVQMKHGGRVFTSAFDAAVLASTP